VGIELALLVQEMLDAMYRSMAGGSYVEMAEGATR
jgi:hypothetical protein